MRVLRLTLLAASLAFAACGQSNPPPAPAAATAPAPVSAPKPATVPATSTAPAASTATHAATAPAPTSAPQPATAPAPTSAAAATAPAPAEATAEGPEVAGGVSLAEGSVTDTAVDGSKRQLKDGDQVYPGDSFVLGDDSYLDIDFTDGGRVLLRPDTTFQIQEFHFEPETHTGANGEPPTEAAPEKTENAFFRLLKGGLRAVDGLIGHSTPQNYAIDTPVATIGVRGTAFDVRYCGDDCADETDASGKPENGLYTAVSEGSIGVKTDAGETVTSAGQYGFVKSRHEALKRLAQAPHALRHMQLPEKFKARDEKNRVDVKARQQKRRALLIQRRQQRLQQQKLKPEPPGKRPAGKPEGRVTPAERREERQERGGALTPAERREKRQEMRQQRQERKEQQLGRRGEGAPASQTRPRALQNPGTSPAERREERQQRNPGAGPAREQRREQREQRREERQERPITAPQPKAEPGKKAPLGKDKCKGKKKKEKGRCGG